MQVHVQVWLCTSVLHMQCFSAGQDRSGHAKSFAGAQRQQPVLPRALEVSHVTLHWQQAPHGNAEQMRVCSPSRKQ